MTLGLHTGRSRWQALVGVFAVLAVATLMMAVAHTGTKLSASPLTGTVTAKTLLIPSRAASSASSGMTDSLAISQIPDSTAVVQDPLKASNPATGKSDDGGHSSSGSPSTSGIPPAGTSGGTAPVASTATSGTVTAGDSKANCISLRFSEGVLTQSVINAATAATGVTFNCMETFANPMPTWSDWEQPWMFSTTSDNYDSWLAASSAHQVVMGMDLIPQSVSDNNDPLTWEQPCADGSYNAYATKLAQNLLSYGAGGIVIRLGIEANGSWEADYTGASTTELNDWAKCFDNEVTAMRAVPGTHFLFVWNPNVCTQDFPLDQWYPGSSYVDIIGADAYDQDCGTLKTVSQEGWSAYANDSSANTPNDPNYPSLNNMEAFAAAHGKPMSFPEWGIGTGLSDDAAYVADMGQMFNNDDFSFQAYFDTGDDSIASLGSDLPNATAAYAKAF
jgi:Glycosyl hydrolase family 26